MKILLVGEYSRLHNSLKEGLIALGHDVHIVADGDKFKKYNVDYSIFPTITAGSWFARKIRSAVMRFTGFDIEKPEKAIRFYFLLPKLKGYSHIQLINSDALGTAPWMSKLLYKKLLKNNKKISLLICGEEPPVVDYNLSGKMRKSIFTPYFEDKSLKKYFGYSLKYITKPYRSLFKWVVENAAAIITSDLDYKIPMEQMGYTVTHIPNPVNTDKIPFGTLQITGKVVIFLGINRLSHIKKGIPYFEEALNTIRQKYTNKVEIIISENVPYHTYIQLYGKAHIVLDQVYGFDQGYNALEAMARGKAVFTAAETEFTQYYNLTGRVAINSLPDAQYLADELSKLIDNPDEITAIGKQARAFIEKEHGHVQIAERYLQAWGF